MNEEIWKDIPEYDGYQASNTGFVKSLNYKNTGKEKILKVWINNRGYHLITLCKNGKPKNELLHRIIAKTFIKNPNNYTEINHIDENKSNNHVNNLEWCNRQYNCEYSLSKCVLQLTKDNKLLAVYHSIKEAERQTGFNHTNISACCRGKLKTLGGCIWRYA